MLKGALEVCCREKAIRPECTSPRWERQAPLKPIKNSFNYPMANGGFNKNPMPNGNNTTKLGSSNSEDNRIEQIASYLVGKFNSPDSWRFYCKVARELPQARIAELAEWSIEKIRQNGGCSGCLFNAVARKEMARIAQPGA